MNNSSTDLVMIKVLGREYKLRCQPAERDALIAASELLDNEMKTIRDSGTIVGMDRIAIMAALNIAHRLIQTQEQQAQSKMNLTRKILQLTHSIDSVLETVHASGQN